MPLTFTEGDFAPQPKLTFSEEDFTQPKLELSPRKIPSSPEELGAENASIQDRVDAELAKNAGLTRKRLSEERTARELEKQQNIDPQSAETVAGAAGTAVLKKLVNASDSFFKFKPEDFESVGVSPDSSKVAAAALSIDPENNPNAAEVARVTGLPKSVASPVLSLGNTGQGLAQFLTSPSGVAQTVASMTPAGLAIRLKWFYDMAKGTGEGLGVAEAKMEKFIQDPSSFTDSDLQELNDATFGAIASLGGAAKMGEHEAYSPTGLPAPAVTKAGRVKQFANALDENINAGANATLGAIAAIQPAIRTKDGVVHVAGFDRFDNPDLQKSGEVKIGPINVDQTHENIAQRLKNRGVDATEGENGFVINGKFLSPEEAAPVAEKLGIETKEEPGVLHSQDVRSAIASNVDNLKSSFKGVSLHKNDDGSVVLNVGGQKSQPVRFIDQPTFDKEFAPQIKSGEINWDTFNGVTHNGEILLKQRYSDTDPIFTHEVLHVLRDSKFISDAQWEKLKGIVTEDDLAAAFKLYKKRPNETDAEHQDNLYHEAIAKKLEDWHRDGVAPEVPRPLLTKIAVGVKSLFDSLKPTEKKTPHQVMQDILNGRLEGAGENAGGPTRFGDLFSKGGYEKLDYTPEDLAKYKKLKELATPSSEEQMNTHEYKQAWKDFEDLRNKYNGMPPKNLYPTLRPALMVGDVAKTGGNSHAEIHRNLIAEAKTTDEKVPIHEALIDDKRHVFVDESGKVYDRKQAAAALGYPEGTELHSEMLDKPVKSGKDVSNEERVSVSPTPEGLGRKAGGEEVRREGVQGRKAEPNPEVQSAVESYNAAVGLPPTQPHYVEVNEARARKIADEYEKLPKIDESPAVLSAYKKLGEEIQAQWDYAINKMGITFEPWTKEGQPYANSREMVKDVRDNKHLYFFTGGEEHPLLNVKDADGLTLNDKLRAVHDLFGHAAEDFQFGPRGEENAWVKHSQMFSPEAQRALTTETRGQNSWVNYGRHNYEGDARKNIAPQDRPFAEQKVALLPEWAQDWKGTLNEDKARFSKVKTADEEPDLEWWKNSEYQRPQNGGGAGNKLRTLKGNPRELVPGESGGKVVISHWSESPRTLIDPNFYGKGIKGEEGDRRIYSKHWLNRSYYGLQGYSKESGLGANRHDVRVDANKLYDFKNDPDDYMGRAIELAERFYPKGDFNKAAATITEKLIERAGYIGYYNPDYAIAAVFKPLKPNRVVKGATESSTRFAKVAPPTPESSESKMRKAWLSPTAGLHYTEGEIHDLWAKKALGLPVDSKESGNQKLFEDGWFRITPSAGGESIIAESAPGAFPSRSQIARLRDMAIETEAKRLLFDTGHGTKILWERPRFSKTEAPLWSDNILNSLAELKQEKLTPEQLKAHLLKTRGAKDQADWIGLDEFLQDKKSVTKSEVEDFVRSAPVELQEITKSIGTPAEWMKMDSDTEGLSQRWELFDPTGKQNSPYAIVEYEPKSPGDEFPWALYRGDSGRRVATYSTLERAKFNAEQYAPKKSETGGTKFDQYQTPGGSNYRELLVTMPPDMGGDREAFVSGSKSKDGKIIAISNGKQHLFDTQSEAEQFVTREQSKPEKNPQQFKSSHFDEPNILGHIRFNERISTTAENPNPVTTLFLEEIQSDWHQKGRKEGYANKPDEKLEARRMEVQAELTKLEHEMEQSDLNPAGRDLEARYAMNEKAKALRAEAAELYAKQSKIVSGVPDAPFKQTQSWAMLLFKRALAWAIDHNFDRVAWTTGDMQAERYDLSKSLNKIVAQREPGTGSTLVNAYDHSGDLVLQKRVSNDSLQDFIGKEMAEKILAQPEDGREHNYSGLDLKVGGKGMRKFYDEMLPNEVNKFVKAMGGKVGDAEIVTRPHTLDESPIAGDNTKVEMPEMRTTVHSLDITPAMRESRQKGFPRFSKTEPTSIKNAVVDEERVKRGALPAMQEAQRSFGKVWDDAEARMKDPAAIENLLKSLKESPRALTDTEDAMLLRHQIALQTAYDEVATGLADAFKRQDREAIATLKPQEMELSNALFDLYDIGKKAGTETGRGLNARKMMANSDFTLANMVVSKRAANGGRELTEAELEDIQNLHDQIKKLQEAHDAYIASAEEKISEANAKAELANAERDAAKSALTINPRIIAAAQKIIGEANKEAGSALERLKARGRVGADVKSRFSKSAAGEPAPSEFTPEDLKDLAQVGQAFLTKGDTSFEAWSKKMVEQLGDWVTPALKETYDAANKLIDSKADKLAAPVREKVKRAVKKLDVNERKAATVEKMKAKVAEGKLDISPSVQKLARILVESGIRERDKLIDAIHAELKQVIPDITRRETMDAISGYGKFSPLTKDEVSVVLRDLKGQMQQIAKIHDMLSGIPPSKTGVERRIPSQKERELIKMVNEAKIKFQVPSTDPLTQLQSALDTKKKWLENQIADYQKKLAEKNFEKKPKRILQYDQRANELHYEMTKAKAAWHEALMKDRIAKRPVIRKIFDAGVEVLNTARAIMTSADFSAVLRQGGFIAFAHPIRAVKSFPAMFKAFYSEKYQHAVNEEIIHRKNYPLYVASKLFLSEHGKKLSQMEEAYMTRWADKIPLVAGSQRAYVTFLNKLRADSFDAMAKSLSEGKELTKVEADAIANFVNVATGRGNFGAKDSALTGLNTVFFAPRLVASRFQMLAGQPLFRGNLATRKLIASEYARFLAGIGMIYALGSIAGASIEPDPRSSDFGKMKFGNTRLDPLAGLSQVTVLLSRLASGKTKKLNGQVVPIRGDKVPYGGKNAADLMASFLRSKLTPVLGSAVNLTTGKNVVGQPVTIGSEAQNLFVPLSFQDIYSTMKEQGIPAGTAFGLLSIFGMGLQNYQPKQKQ